MAMREVALISSTDSIICCTLGRSEGSKLREDAIATMDNRISSEMESRNSPNDAEMYA